MSIQAAVSTALGNAITAGMDPMNGMVQQFGAAQIAQIEANVARSNADLLKELRKELETAKQNAEDAAVVDGYRAMVRKFSGMVK